MLATTNHIFFNAYTLKAPADGPHVLILGGVHGDEFEPMLAALNLIGPLQQRLQRGKVTLVPVVNMSAFEQGARCGTDALDLARTLPGHPDGTVSEQLAHHLSELIKTADYLIDLHTGGALFDILPLCGYLLHDREEVLQQQQAMAQAFGLPVIWGTDARVEGRTLSVARDFKIPAIYAECRGGLSANRDTIQLYEKGCLRVLAHLKLITPDTRASNDSYYWLEDYTPGQGHLQVKLPAPENGIFIPAVSVGQKVVKDTPLGELVHPLRQTRTTITAPEEGLVLMVRISSKVKEGESLGGILPISEKGKKRIYAN